MKVTGTLHGEYVYHTDTGYDACVWKYRDTKTIAEARVKEMKLWKGILQNEDPDAPEEWTQKEAWRHAFGCYPTKRVPFGHVKDIITENSTYGDECLKKAVVRSEQKQL